MVILSEPRRLLTRLQCAVPIAEAEGLSVSFLAVRANGLTNSFQVLWERALPKVFW